MSASFPWSPARSSASPASSHVPEPNSFAMELQGEHRLVSALLLFVFLTVASSLSTYVHACAPSLPRLRPCRCVVHVPFCSSLLVWLNRGFAQHLAYHRCTAFEISVPSLFPPSLRRLSFSVSTVSPTRVSIRLRDLVLLMFHLLASLLVSFAPCQSIQLPASLFLLLARYGHNPSSSLLASLTS
jgi:hypothetical protein